MKLKRIGVFSSTKSATLIGAFVGFIAGVLYSFGGLIIDMLVSLGWITSAETPGLSYGTVLAFGALIGMPIIFAGFGFAIGTVGAVFYNMAARWVGGIEIELEQDNKE